MKWILIYLAITNNNHVSNRVELETKDLCVKRAAALIEQSRQRGVTVLAACQNAETGEVSEIRWIPTPN